MLVPLTHQDVVDQRLIGPGVVEGRGHVYVSIHQDKQRPMKTGQKEKDNQTQRTGGVASGVGSAGPARCVQVSGLTADFLQN